MEEMNEKLEQAKNIIEAFKKLDTEQVTAFTNAIVGAAMVNQLVEMNKKPN